MRLVLFDFGSTCLNTEIVLPLQHSNFQTSMTLKSIRFYRYKFEIKQFNLPIFSVHSNSVSFVDLGFCLFFVGLQSSKPDEFVQIFFYALYHVVLSKSLLNRIFFLFISRKFIEENNCGMCFLDQFGYKVKFFETSLFPAKEQKHQKCNKIHNPQSRRG